MKTNEVIQVGILQLTFGRPVVPGTRWSLLSNPGKMPGLAFGIPAMRTCPGNQVGENTICGSCYANPNALKEWANGTKQSRRAGTYGNRSVQMAQAERYEWTQRCLMTADGRDYWVAYMTAAIAFYQTKRSKYDYRYFRIHDSGDMFSREYVEMWARVATNLPGVRFWAPTRSWNVDKPGLSLLARARILRTSDALRELASLPNVTVRPSALWFDFPAPHITGLHAGTGARRTGWTCPSHANGNTCGTCRTCWIDKETEVYYHVH